MRVGRYVENFIGANAGVGAGSDIANTVSASLASGDIYRGEPAHDAGRVVNLDIVELKILAGRNMGDAIGVFFRQLAHYLELLSIETAAGNLDALHARGVPHGHWALGQIARWIADLLYLLPVVPLAVIIALAIRAPAKPGFGKKALIQLAVLSQRDFGFKYVNLASHVLRHFSSEVLFPKRIRSLHDSFLSVRSEEH